MAAKSRARAPKPRVVPTDLGEVVREALRSYPAATATLFKKALPKSHAKFHKEATAEATRLVALGEAFVFNKSKKDYFFAKDPIKTLDETLPRSMGADVHNKASLMTLVNEVAPGHAVALDEWIKRALGRGRIFERLVAERSKARGYTTQPPAPPDPKKVLQKVLSELGKALPKADQQGIPRTRIANVLLAALELPALSAWDEAPPPARARSEFLTALRELGEENPRDALLPVRALREKLALSKEVFDSVALELMREGAVSLHNHDHPASLPELERSQLVQDARGTHYNGIAARSPE